MTPIRNTNTQYLSSVGRIQQRLESDFMLQGIASVANNQAPRGAVMPPSMRLPATSRVRVATSPRWEPVSASTKCLSANLKGLFLALKPNNLNLNLEKALRTKFQEEKRKFASSLKKGPFLAGKSYQDIRAVVTRLNTVVPKQSLVKQEQAAVLNASTLARELAFKLPPTDPDRAFFNTLALGVEFNAISSIQAAQFLKLEAPHALVDAFFSEVSPTFRHKLRHFPEVKQFAGGFINEMKNLAVEFIRCGAKPEAACENASDIVQSYVAACKAAVKAKAMPTATNIKKRDTLIDGAVSNKAKLASRTPSALQYLKVSQARLAFHLKNC